MEPKVEGAFRTPDGYWLVEIVRYWPRERWYRISHATTVVVERASLGTVQHILGDAFSTLQPVDAEAASDGGIA
jgi:hypothetical protein